MYKGGFTDCQLRIYTKFKTSYEEEVNGTKYYFIGNYYSTTMKVGDKIKIMYNQNNPKKATTKKGLNLAVVILGAFTIISFIVLIILQSV